MKTLYVSSDSCNGQESEFIDFVNSNYDEINAVDANGHSGGLFDENGDMEQNNLWDEFCSQ